MRVGLSGEMWAERYHQKVGIYAPTGGGKTHWLSTAPRPMIILCEPQGMSTVGSVRDDALIVVVKSFREFERLWERMKQAIPVEVDGMPGAEVDLGKLGKHQFCTLGLDSMSALQEMMTHVLGSGKTEKEIKAFGKMLAARNINEGRWGQLITTTKTILEDMRAIPANTIVTFLASEAYDSKGKRRVIPGVYGRKLPLQLGAYFNAFGYLTLHPEHGRIIQWGAHSTYAATKPAPGWPEVTRRTLNPGECSLGSIMLAHAPRGAVTACEPTDNATYAQPLKQEKESDQ